MVAACSKSLAISSSEECKQHAQKIKRAYLAAQCNILDGIVAIAHLFLLGIMVYSSLAAAVTAIETASISAAEYTVQSIAIQLPFIAEDNPGRLLLLDKTMVGPHLLFVIVPPRSTAIKVI